MIFQRKRDRHNREDSPVIRAVNSNSSADSVLPELALPHKDKPHKLNNNNHLNISARLLSLKNRLEEFPQKSKEPKNSDAKEIKAAFDYEFKSRPKKHLPPAIKEKEISMRQEDIKNHGISMRLDNSKLSDCGAIKNRLMKHDKGEDK